MNNKSLFFAEIESMHKTTGGSYSWRNYLIERRIVVFLLCLSSYVGALTTQKQLSGKPVTYTIPVTLSSRYCNYKLYNYNNKWLIDLISIRREGS